jgi:hypothetical protein
MAHHLVDHPGRDAGVLQPGGEGMPKVVSAPEIHGFQQWIAGPGQCPPTLVTVLAGAGDQLGSDEFAAGELSRDWE